MNPMKKIKIEKIVLNIGCGKDKNPEHAAKVLEKITNRKATLTKTHKRTTFGVSKNKPIGAMVTVRSHCNELLKKLLDAVENKLKASNFDSFGNFAFGIPEYIMIHGISYDPNIEMFGLDVCITLERPGYHIKKRRLSGKIGKSHLITKKEAIEWVKSNFDVEITNA